MNVCMLTYSFYESDTRVMQYATALAERGHAVDVFALGRKGAARKEVLDGVSVHRIQTRQVNERGRLGYLLRIIRFFLVATLVLARRQWTRRYRLVHVHSVPDFLVFAALIPKLRGARVILDIHDILPEFYASKFRIGPGSIQFRLLLLVEQASCRFADHVIIANDLWRERLVARSVPPAKCTAICNYPDLRVFASPPRPRRNGRFRIVYPGTLNAHQGLDIALRSFARITGQLPGGEFHIYGEGPEKPALRKLADDLELDGRVHFHDWLPTSEIVTVMAAADLAVVPKRASSAFGNEAASTKILEFMALGVPVIVSRTRIDAHYFDEGVVRFYESENESALAESILALRNDPALREAQVARAARFVERNNWGVKKQEYFGLVERLTRRPQAANP